MPDSIGINAGEPVRISLGEALSQGHLRQVCYTLNIGGIALIPSDTAYSLAALPFRRDSMAHLASLQPQKATESVLLAFGTLKLVKQYATLTAKDERLIDAHCPGPLTLVCEIASTQNKVIIEDMLHTHGTIGVRIPASAVERQISVELERPITTCAIRDDQGNPTRSFDDAFSILRERLKRAEVQFPISAVRLRRISVQELSTIASVQKGALPTGMELFEPYQVFILRPGAIEAEQLESSVRKLWPCDIEEWT